MYWPDIWAGNAADQISAPQIKPDNVSFVDNIAVTLSCATSGAEFRYTTNGQTPTASSALYSSNIVLTETATIKAIAIKDGKSSNVSEKTYVKTVLKDAENPVNTENGLWYRYYEGSWSNLPNFSTLTKKDSGKVANFILDSKKVVNNFAFVFYGYIDAPQDGLYQFTLASDDGSRLKIGDTEVINNDGLHAADPKTGSIGLKAGKHSITVEYFDAGGAVSLAVSWEMGSLVPKQAIPAGALFRVKDTEIPWVEALTPVTDQKIGLGDTLVLKWTYHLGSNHGIKANLSIDGGKTYPYSLTEGNAYWMGAKEDGEIKYQVPQDPAMVTNQAKISIADYNGQGITGYTGNFRIVLASALNSRGIAKGANSFARRGNVLEFSINGRARSVASGTSTLSRANTTGIYFVKKTLGHSARIEKHCWVD
jgi:hypothetical protein